jgi:hypothetical protein
MFIFFRRPVAVLLAWTLLLPAGFAANKKPGLSLIRISSATCRQSPTALWSIPVGPAMRL